MAGAFVKATTTGGTISAGTSGNAAFASNTAAGNAVLLAVQTSATGITASTVTDADGNLYVKEITGNNASGGECSLWYANNVKGGSVNTITLGLSGTGSAGFIGLEYSGVIVSPQSSVFRDRGTSATGSAITTAALGNTGLGQVADVWITAVGTPTTARTITPTTGGQTVRGTSITTPVSLAVGDITLGSTVQTIACTWGLGVSSAYSGCSLGLRSFGQPFILSRNGVNNATPAASFTIAPSIAQQLGSFMALVVALPSGTATVSTVTDTQSNLWTFGGRRQSSLGAVSVEVWYCFANNGTTPTLTVTPSATLAYAAMIYEVGGTVPCPTIVDQTAGADSAASTGTAVSVGPTGTTAIKDEFVLLAVAALAGETSPTAGAGYTCMGSTSNATVSACAVSKYETTVTTETPTLTLPTTAKWAGLAITFQTGPVRLCQVQRTTGTTTAINKLPNNVAAGNLLLAGAIVSSTTQTISTLTDSVDTTTKEAAAANTNTGGSEASLWSDDNASGGPHTLTATATGTPTVALTVAEYSGIRSAPADVAAVSATGSGTAPSAGATGTTQGNYNLAVSVGGDGAATQSWTGSGNGAPAVIARGATPNGLFGHQIFTTRTTEQETWTLAATRQWSAVTATYKATGAVSTYSLQAPAFAALFGTQSREASGSAALLTTGLQLAPATAVLLGTVSRQAPANAQLFGTSSTSAAASAALAIGQTHAQAAVALLRTNSTQAASVSAMLATVSRQATTTAAFTGSETRTATAAATLLASVSRTGAASAALLASHSIAASTAAKFAGTQLATAPARAGLKSSASTQAGMSAVFVSGSTQDTSAQAAAIFTATRSVTAATRATFLGTAQSAAITRVALSTTRELLAAVDAALLATESTQAQMFAEVGTVVTSSAEASSGAAVLATIETSAGMRCALSIRMLDPVFATAQPLNLTARCEPYATTAEATPLSTRIILPPRT